ncbi:MAG: transcriptional regulator [Gammaproteobacteria bacterium]|nr:MAG: transcriptional regulator [Gammaproteobacteria bacterium]
MRKTIYSQSSQILTECLRNSRKSAKLTIRQLAEKMEVHHSIIGKIETGERRLDVIEFIEYCQVLDLNPHVVIDKIIVKSRH